ncbi:MAG: TIM barrel protein [Chloroflexota bacterium]
MSSNQTGELLFGTGGVPVSAKSRSTEAGIERIAELGLGCMEVEFVQGVRMSPEVAISVGKLAARKKVALTAHGPYFINLNAAEPQKVHMSKERILQTARIAALFGAISITLHAAFYMKGTTAETYTVVKKRLQELVNTLHKEGNKVTVSPEVTGKPSQFGTLEEILQLSSEIEGVAPCIDFSHWHARTGKANSYQEFLHILEQVERKLGRWGLDNMHIHVSGIAYGNKGEIKHLMLPESDLQYTELLKALKERKAKGVVICESVPYLEQDALLLQQTYQELR